MKLIYNQKHIHDDDGVVKKFEQSV